MTMNAVIPAKAGIHFDFRFFARLRSKMDSGFRWNDGVESEASSQRR
jgi:hypothetical protein